jgi:hypothetical protein
MKTTRKNWTLLLTSALLLLCLILTQPVSAQSTPTVTEFTLQYIDNSYDTPPTTTSTQDPYNGQVTTTTQPSTHTENKTVIATIKNPSGATYYNFRWKGHYDTTWQYEPFNPDSGSNAYTLADTFSVPFKASTSTNTVLWLYFIHPESITPGGSIDIQVQALYGGFRAVPYGHIEPIPGGPTYDFYFNGSTSDWSSTQTMMFGQATSAPSPTVPEFPATAILPLFIVIPLIAVIFIRKYVAKSAVPYSETR